MKKMVTKLTPQEAKFVTAKLEGKNNTEAAMVAKGSTSKDVAKKQGNRLSTNVNIQQAIQEQLSTHNLTTDRLLNKLDQALEAQKLIVHGKSSDEAWTEEVPDWTAQLKALDISFKLVGAFTKLKEKDEPPVPTKELAEEIKKALQSGDEVEVQRLLFSRRADSNSDVS